MGERISRAWNTVRRREPDEDADAGARCGASGWHLSSGCSDGDGMAVCPLCSQRVHTTRAAAIPRGVEVLEAHCA
jgi:hypothetical protein